MRKELWEMDKAALELGSKAFEAESVARGARMVAEEAKAEVDFQKWADWWLRQRYAEWKASLASEAKTEEGAK